MDREERGGREPDPGTGPTLDDDQEDAEPEQGFIRELSQFFVVPSLIVLLCVGIFIMFGLIASEEKTASEFLQDVRTRTGNDRWQAAFEFSRVIARNPNLGSDGRLVREIASTIRDEGSQDPTVRRYLIIALEHLGSREAGPVLIDSLRDSDPEVRLQAARALAELESVPGAAGPLADLLTDESAALRKVATYALGQTRDPSAIPDLLPRLEDPVEDVKWNAALALAVLGDGSGRGVIATMLDRRHLDRLEGITEEQKISAMINALQAVYMLKDESLLPIVKELSRADPSLKVRGVALQALAEMEEQ